MKTKRIWLTRAKDWESEYMIASTESVLRKDGLWYVTGRGQGTSFCPVRFQSFAPALKLKKGEQVELKLTQLKNGIKLERVKK